MKFIMKTHSILFAFTMLVFIGKLTAEPMTYYTILNNHEETRLGEYLYYGIEDTIFGFIRTNDFLPVGGNAVYGRLITSQELMFEGNEFELENVIEHAPPFPFPERLDYLRAHAAPHVPSQNNRMMTWIKFRGEQGIDIYQYPSGTPRNDSVYAHLAVPSWQTIFVDGDVEVEGYAAGQVTVYSSGNMYLIDNIQYLHSDRRNGWFEHEGFPHILGLVSDRNIIIKDNSRNGKENGWFEGGGWGGRHSININGSLIALGGSFTFEHQNDDHDLYQGPEPDERGFVNLKGSVAQFRRGYLHRDNHGGTGYRMKYNMDVRLLRYGPPGFRPGEYPDISGRHDRLLLIDGTYTFTNVSVNKLIVPAGVEILLDGANALTVHDSLIVLGTEDEPVTIRTRIPNSRSRFHIDRGNRAYVSMKHTNFSDEIEVDFEFDSLKVKHCQFDGPVSLEGNISVDSSYFSDQVELTSWESMRVSRSVFEGEIDIGGDVRDGELINNTIVNSHFSGIILRRFSNLRIINNLIAHNRYGINNQHHEQPELAFNCVYDNTRGDWVDCNPGEGSISEDPLMFDYEECDYTLTAESSCIDAGDPSSPLDPDDTRADIGAFYFDHEPWSIEVNPVPDDFLVSTFPNPFNRSVKVSISNSIVQIADWSIVNIQGQLISQGKWSLKQGKNEFTLNNHNIDIPGVYFLQLDLNRDTKQHKLLYIP